MSWRTRDNVGQDGQSGGRSSAIWHHGGLEYLRTLTLGLGAPKCAKRLQVHGRVGEEKTSEHQQRKRGAEKADKVEVAPGVIVGSLRGFRAVE